MLETFGYETCSYMLGYAYFGRVSNFFKVCETIIFFPSKFVQDVRYYILPLWMVYLNLVTLIII